MTRLTEKTPRVETLPDVRLVETGAIPSRRPNVQEGSTISKALWKESPTRCHVAMLHDQVAGWARSISVNDSSWCDRMFVKREFRRRGIGRALVITYCGRIAQPDLLHLFQLLVMRERNCIPRSDIRPLEPYSF